MVVTSNEGARYQLRRADPERGQLSAFQWLVSLDPRLGFRDGKPNLTRIAAASGLSISMLSLLDRGARLGMTSMAALVQVGMLAGASRALCEEMLFEYVPSAGLASRLVRVNAPALQAVAA